MIGKIILIVFLCALSLAFITLALGGFKVSYEEKDDELTVENTKDDPQK